MLYPAQDWLWAGLASIIAGNLNRPRAVTRLSRFAINIAVELVVKRFEADAQLLGRGRFVAAQLLQSCINSFHFQLPKRFSDAANWNCVRSLVSKRVREIGARDRHRIAQNTSVLDDVCQFANVSGPVMRLK